MASIQPPIRGDGHDARDLTPLAHPPEDRGQPAPRPGRPGRARKLWPVSSKSRSVRRSRRAFFRTAKLTGRPAVREPQGKRRDRGESGCAGFAAASLQAQAQAPPLLPVRGSQVSRRWSLHAGRGSGDQPDRAAQNRTGGRCLAPGCTPLTTAAWRPRGESWPPLHR
jgi:hypothetical protein